MNNLPAIPMVFVPRGYSVADEFEEAIRVGGVRPPLAVLSELREERLPMVVSGIGGTLLERSMAESADEPVVIREIEPNVVRPFAIAFHPPTLSPVGKAFVELIREFVG